MLMNAVCSTRYSGKCCREEALTFLLCLVVLFFVTVIPVAALDGWWQRSKAEVVKAAKLLLCQMVKKLQPSLQVFCFDLLTE